MSEIFHTFVFNVLNQSFPAIKLQEVSQIKFIVLIVKSEFDVWPESRPID